MLEKNIVKRIMARLKDEGFFCIKIHGSEYQMAGLPDVLALKDGRAYWLEVKRPGGKATALQLRMIEKLKECGCVAGVVYSVEDARRLVGVE